MQDVTFPIRVMKLMGVKYLFGSVEFNRMKALLLSLFHSHQCGRRTELSVQCRGSSCLI